MNKIISTVAVLGPGDCEPGSPQYLLGEEIGRLIAKRGLSVVTGGFGGVMEAAAKGAVEAGGHSIGFTMLGKPSNKWIRKTVDCQWQSVGVDGKGIIDSDTEQYSRRLGRLLNSDGLIAVAGNSSGTFAEVLTFAHLAKKELIKHKWLAIVFDDDEGQRAAIRWENFLNYLFAANTLSSNKGHCLPDLSVAFVSPERALDCSILGWDEMPE